MVDRHQALTGNEHRLVRLFEAHRKLLTTSGDPQSVPALARSAGVSPFHFLRVFRSTFGQTPHQLSMEARLMRAKQLLLETDLSVTEICFECGYESLGSFSHLFRQRVGCSPRAFRNQGQRYWPVNIEFLRRVIPFCLLDGFR
jgi:AraC-like DNA-binding protein